jgi:hypothetical protein
MMKNQPQWSFPENTLRNPSPFLAEYIRENSNHELEWLWAVDYVTEPEEKLYCMRRVLYINPRNEEIERLFHSLTRSLKEKTQSRAAARPAGLPLLFKRLFRIA